MAQPVLNQDDPQVIEDAVKLLKSDFVALYEKQGFNKILVGIAWHNIRIAPKAQALAAKAYPPGKDKSQALSFISNIDEEIQARAQSTKKLVKVKVEKKPPVVEEQAVEVATTTQDVFPAAIVGDQIVVTTEQPIVAVKVLKSKVKEVVAKPKSDKGERGRRAKELIAQGATADELVEKAGVARLYALMLIRQSKQPKKKKKK